MRLQLKNTSIYIYGLEYFIYRLFYFSEHFNILSLNYPFTFISSPIKKTFLKFKILSDYLCVWNAGRRSFGRSSGHSNTDGFDYMRLSLCRDCAAFAESCSNIHRGAYAWKLSLRDTMSMPSLASCKHTRCRIAYGRKIVGRRIGMQCYPHQYCLLCSACDWICLKNRLSSTIPVWQTCTIILVAFRTLVDVQIGKRSRFLHFFYTCSSKIWYRNKF